MFSSQDEIYLTVIGGGILMILLASIIIIAVLSYQKRYYKLLSEQESVKKIYESSLLHSQIEVQEATFQHIGKDLHDNVGQLLSTTKMLIGVTEMNMQTVPDTLSTAQATLSKAIQELRLLSRSLDKEWLQQFSFTDNLTAEIERINAAGIVIATCNIKMPVTIKAAEQIILFRIVQEAVQNALRHANPGRLCVDVDEINNMLEVKVLNNGTPLPPNFNGMGTNNMKHRTSLLGGTINWQQVQQGTVVIIKLPLNHHS
jgi:signal transduction histidine kinase